MNYLRGEDRGLAIDRRCRLAELCADRAHRKAPPLRMGAGRLTIQFHR
jgi:hypothetical protein